MAHRTAGQKIPQISTNQLDVDKARLRYTDLGLILSQPKTKIDKKTGQRYTKIVDTKLGNVKSSKKGSIPVYSKDGSTLKGSNWIYTDEYKNESGEIKNRYNIDGHLRAKEILLENNIPLEESLSKIHNSIKNQEESILIKLSSIFSKIEETICDLKEQTKFNEEKLIKLEKLLLNQKPSLRIESDNPQESEDWFFKTSTDETGTSTLGIYHKNTLITEYFEDSYETNQYDNNEDDFLKRQEKEYRSGVSNDEPFMEEIITNNNNNNNNTSISVESFLNQEEEDNNYENEPGSGILEEYIINSKQEDIEQNQQKEEHEEEKKQEEEQEQKINESLDTVTSDELLEKEELTNPISFQPPSNNNNDNGDNYNDQREKIREKPRVPSFKQFQKKVTPLTLSSSKKKTFKV